MSFFHCGNKEGSKINQIICAILINLPVFAYGASIGWMSPMTLLLQSKDSPKDDPLTDNEVSWMASVAYLTCIPGNFLMAFLGDTLGRKNTLLIISATGAVSWILLLSSIDVWALILARALVGITMAGCYVTCPIYTKEISDDNIRGALGCLLILFHTCGNLFMYVIGDILRYRSIIWVCLSLPILHLVLFMMMPDSPSYLVKTGNIEEAARVLSWLRCRKENDSSILSELELINKEQKRDKKDGNRFLLKDIVKDQILLKAFTIALIATLTREVCGAVPVLNFAAEIFALASKDSSLSLSPNQQAMLLGAVQVGGSALASSIVEKAGRKPMLVVTSLISGLSMCAFASWFVALEYEAYTPSWIPIVALCICIFCDSSGLQPISVVIAGEMFSFKYRGTVMATTMSVAAFADFLQLLFFKPLASVIGIHIVFYFFGVICVLMSIYVIFFVPETKARKLESIYEDLRNNKNAAVIAAVT